jgi:BolA protein
MSVEDTIHKRLSEAFAPLELRVENDSARHAGHHAMREHDPEVPGETHFTVHIVSDAFAGKSRIERHRMVNDALAAELAGPVHALNIKALEPSEA